MLTRVGCGVLVLCLLTVADRSVRAQFGASDERKALQQYEPTPIRVPRLGQGVGRVRLRFYADAEFRAATVRWQEHARREVATLNAAFGQPLGVAFEVESLRRWDRKGPSVRLEPMLEELEALDPGLDVDWVVGLVAPLSIVSTAIHDLGMARTLGRHFVLRDMSSIEDLDAFRRAFQVLDRSDRPALEALYGRRKQHKQLVVFFHEWAHTLGAIHTGDPTNVMCPTYDHRTSLLAPVDAGLLDAALKDRVAARGKETVVWTNLRGFMAGATAPGWYASERDALVALLRAGGTGATGGARPSTGGLGKADASVYERAMALVRQSKDEAAWTTLAPLAAQRPRAPEVTRLVCRLSHLPAAGEQALGACEQALAEADAGDPGPFVDAAQAHILRKDWQKAQALTNEVEARSARATPARGDAWLWVAQLHQQIGSLTRAEAALGRSEAAGGDARLVANTRRAIARHRRWLGLTGPPGGAPVAPADEPAYAQSFTAAQDLVNAGKLREARAAIADGLRRFPRAPGFRVLSCEALLREGRLRQGLDQCAAALKISPELPRAHYLVGHARLGAGDAKGAVEPLRRAIALDPSEPGPWQSLGDAYRSLGRRKEYQQLLIEQAEQDTGARPALSP